MVFNDQPRDIIYIYIWPMADRTYVSNTHAHVRMSIIEYFAIEIQVLRKGRLSSPK